MPGLNPTNQDENEELAATCIMAINDFGGLAKVAVNDGNYIHQSSAAFVLAQCWDRRNKWGLSPTTSELVEALKAFRSAVTTGRDAGAPGYSIEIDLEKIMAACEKWDELAPHLSQGATTNQQEGRLSEQANMEVRNSA